MNQYALLLICVLVFLCAYVAWSGCNRPSGEVEGYRRRRYGRLGGYYGGWGSYWGWPYRAGIYSSWPPYLYGGYGYPYGRYPRYRYGDKCVTSNEASDCEPAYPVKIGTDTTGDGNKDSWKCCRKY